MKVTNPVIFSKAGFVQKPSQYKKHKRTCGGREMKKQSNKTPKHQNQASKQTKKTEKQETKSLERKFCTKSTTNKGRKETMILIFEDKASFIHSSTTFYNFFT